MLRIMVVGTSSSRQVAMTTNTKHTCPKATITMVDTTTSLNSNMEIRCMGRVNNSFKIKVRMKWAWLVRRIMCSSNRTITSLEIRLKQHLRY